MRTCDLFDKYRDGELASAEQSAFQSHLAICEDCRMKMALLNNLVQVLRQEEVTPMDLADSIARKAFQRDQPWDALSFLAASRARASGSFLDACSVFFPVADSGYQPCFRVFGVSEIDG